MKFFVESKRLHRLTCACFEFFIFSLTCLLYLNFRVSLIAARQVTIKNGSFYVNGRKFFVKGIGYETHTRPGQVPWEYSFEPNLIRLDLARIREAGFNTIRTWDALSAEELKLVEESGLMVLMGIWIDPNGDFGDPAFIQEALNRVTEVVSYSKKSPALLGYLMMNEVTVDHISSVGAVAVRTFWERIAGRIRELAPGVPVSVSQAAVGDFVRADLFDFVAFNLYSYNPLLLKNVVGYAGFVEWLKKRLAPDKPMIITEFGLSVSPTGSRGPFGYGGNTLEEQAEGIVQMYRGLIEGGAQGGCVFQYHDGWWKAGEPLVHNDHPEEWFGLFAFANSDDKIGSPRPAWQAIADYQQALVISPVNGGIYPPDLPIEIFIDEPITQVKIIWQHEVLARRSVVPGEWYYETLHLQPVDSLSAGTLRFGFYDSSGQLYKSETISVLIQQKDVTFPSLAISLYPDNPLPGNTIRPVFRVLRGSGEVEIGDTLWYGFFPHIGFDPGEARAMEMDFLGNEWKFTDGFYLPLESKVFSFGAAIKVHYGSWEKRLYSIMLRRVDHWAEELSVVESANTIVDSKPLVSHPSSMLYAFPNPFNGSTNLLIFMPHTGRAQLVIYDLSGRIVFLKEWAALLPGYHSLVWDGESCASGIYVVRFKTDKGVSFIKLVLVR